VSVAVVVPLAGACPYRTSSWSWLRARYAIRHPDWQVVEARAPSDPWSKGAAVNPSLAVSDAEIVVLADADVWTDGLGEAVEQVEAGAAWAIPHTLVHRLSEDGTVATLAGEDWRGQPVDQAPYRGLPGGGAVAAPMSVLQSVPLDHRFLGWGQEDECHAFALSTLVGEPWRGEADLFHLWHPPQERLSRRRGSTASWELRRRYHQARREPRAMRALIEESRDASPTAEPRLHDHA
jgi:hypothetical protein